MIRSIRLTNWRAYASLDLDLQRPVTFFVAPNGVGKSSLVEAVRWGLLGTPDDRNRGRAVRAGMDVATVKLVVTLPGPTEVEVTRELKRTGTAKFHAIVDGNEVEEADYRQLISRGWAADPGLLDSLIFGPTYTTKNTSSFPLRDHLADILGVTQLLEAADKIKVRRAQIAEHIKTLRTDFSGTDSAISAAVDDATTIEAEVVAARAARENASASLRSAESRARASAAWEQYRGAADEYNTQILALVDEMSSVLVVGDRNPRDALDEADRVAAQALAESSTAATEAQVRAATAASAAELLAANEDRCPTCLRPFSEGEHATAVAAQGHEQTDSGLEIETYQREAALARERVAQIAEFSRALSELRPPTQPDEQDPGPPEEGLLESARLLATEASERLGAVSNRLDIARESLSSLRQAVADQEALVTTEREDIVLAITQKALSDSATRYMSDRVEPLTAEISQRWKLVFGGEGLRLNTDGALSLSHGEVDLALQEFSGGERATALLVTRLLLAASATRVSTMWFDEPLEHLDPRRRAAVAQTIVRAAQLGAVDQIIVTTYEEEIARRLATTAPDHVQVTYARKGSTD